MRLLILCEICILFFFIGPANSAVKCRELIEASSGAAALAQIGPKGEMLSFQGYYFPTRSTANTKSSRFTGVIIDNQGSKVSVHFDVESKNLENNGLKAPNWAESGSSILSVESPSGYIFETIQLLSTGLGYDSKFAATKRFTDFEGIAVTITGLKFEITVRVIEKNLEPNGLNPARWEPAKEAMLWVAPL